MAPLTWSCHCCQKFCKRLIKEQFSTRKVCCRKIFPFNDNVYIKIQLLYILCNFKYISSVMCLSAFCIFNSLLFSFTYKINATSLQSVFSIYMLSQPGHFTALWNKRQTPLLLFIVCNRQHKNKVHISYVDSILL